MARRRSNGILSLGFNQDQGCFVCCLKNGLRIYNVDPLVEKTHYSKDDLGEVALCEMVYRTNWLLVVKLRHPGSLFLIDDKNKTSKAEVRFKSAIRALRARRDKVAVVLSSSIHVLSLPSFQRVALLRTPAIFRPLCAFALDPNSAILAATAHRRGSIQIIDVSRTVGSAYSSSPAVMGCHQSALVCISLTRAGDRVATASERGTLIRIWDTYSKNMLHELRRGSDFADVYCITFNSSATLVCCVSDKGTVHVWTAHGAHIAAARVEPGPRRRTACAFRDDNGAVVITEDGTLHNFTFAMESNWRQSQFDYFLQVGEDEDFME